MQPDTYIDCLSRVLARGYLITLLYSLCQTRLYIKTILSNDQLNPDEEWFSLDIF